MTLKPLGCVQVEGEGWLNVLCFFFFHRMCEQFWFTTPELKQMSQLVFPLREPHFPFE